MNNSDPTSKSSLWFPLVNNAFRYSTNIHRISSPLSAEPDARDRDGDGPGGCSDIALPISLNSLRILGSHSCCLSGVHHLPRPTGWGSGGQAYGPGLGSPGCSHMAWPEAGRRASTQKLGGDYLPNASLPLAGSRSQHGGFNFLFFSTLSGLVVWK